MEETLLTFQKFKDPEIAGDIAEKLIQSGIKCEVEDDHKFFDPSFARDPMLNETRIKIRPSDFPKADKVLNDYYHSLVDSIDKDYYLFEFSEEELLKILAEPDDWGQLDYQLAQKIMNDRGKAVTMNELESLKNKRLAELAKPENSQTGLIVAGYISAVFGGIFGLIIGWVLSSSKRTLPNGQLVYTYTKSDREHGKAISIIALVLVIFVLFYSLSSRYL